MLADELVRATYFDIHSGFSFDYYEPDEVDKALAELREKYELAVATIKEYKNDIANLNEKLDEAQYDTDNCGMA